MCCNRPYRACETCFEIAHALSACHVVRLACRMDGEIIETSLNWEAPMQTRPSTVEQRKGGEEEGQTFCSTCFWAAKGVATNSIKIKRVGASGLHAKFCTVRKQLSCLAELLPG
mmetsp:Transcript_21485/g.37739  ORF Transcript_21485/g.37739 Transcript_21485/m.37739 type:complete len:114 (+) Transcript_21485:236-577(+)